LALGLPLRMVEEPEAGALTLNFCSVNKGFSGAMIVEDQAFSEAISMMFRRLYL
jgi:hypothetical protein